MTEELKQIWREMAQAATWIVEGKEVELRRRGSNGPWRPKRHDLGLYPNDEYRLKPEPKMIPWGPEDVKPGMVFRGAGRLNGWDHPMSVSDAGIGFAGPICRYLRWSELQDGVLWSLDGKTWARCEKEEK